MKFKRTLLPITFALTVTASLVLAACGDDDDAPAPPPTSSIPNTPQNALATKTPIKHVVVIFGENVSFDHYFGTYPKAANLGGGEPTFTAADGTPTVNGLTDALLSDQNPNVTNADNAAAGDPTPPFRLTRAQAYTASQNHGYTAEQQAYDDGKMDLFPKYTGAATAGGSGAFGTKWMVMGYFDGNTVTGLWNYAQHYAMSDNMWTDTFGPSTPGALEVGSGQTNGINPAHMVAGGAPYAAGGPLPSGVIADGAGSFTVVGDPDPYGDKCSGGNTVEMTGKNIGDLLNEKNITWGGFMGGFDLTKTNPDGSTDCGRTTSSDVVTRGPVADYSPHHAFFQYYPSTANLNHDRPSSPDRIGYSTQADGKTADPAKHQYDIDDFFDAVKAGNFPSVAYLKAPAIQDGHPGNSDPLDEQAFVTKVVNFLQQQPDWQDTAVIVTYDDSDGWYDHQSPTITSASLDATNDQLNGAGKCGDASLQPVGPAGDKVNGRCGPGTRVPFILISPWAKVNYVSHEPISQASVVKFIEDNWLDGKRLGGGSFDATAGDISDMFDFSGKTRAPKLFLDESTGIVTAAPAKS